MFSLFIRNPVLFVYTKWTLFNMEMAERMDEVIAEFRKFDK